MDDDIIAKIERYVIANIGKSIIWRASRLIVGIIPPLGAFVMLCHCTLLLNNIHFCMTEWLFDCSLLGAVAWLIVSLAYGFCWVHRAFITYGVMIGFCIDFQRTFGFGSMLIPLRYAMVILGVVLFAIFIHKKAWEEFYHRNINHLDK